ncbi:hypothetical protein BH24ACT5_BH24ACT5_16170 [soil metagenome]
MGRRAAHRGERPLVVSAARADGEQGASDDSMAKPIAASVGARVNVGMLPDANPHPLGGLAMAPSSTITSGPGTSPHSTVWAPHSSATSARSTNAPADMPVLDRHRHAITKRHSHP